MTVPAIFYLLLAIGVLISSLNFYLSFLRYPLWQARGGVLGDFKWASGFPFIGSLLILGCLLFVQLPTWVFITSAVAAILDTGGIHWLLFTLIKHRND
ncbi:hypothetical protein K2D_30210 [Planctomycetes bacterium K2D]|uniref:PQ loop repeat protein n=1 Tax=Botrimarina mediterranea TaxID=2528022 RepID=A0A518KAE3_9BACT|nr:hypothetical protein Spa11_29700 [Botrimarina mediterranea]QDV79407.1 hypothetical protein K2D_30210 [Planctomycetes bacterium K2D]